VDRETLKSLAKVVGFAVSFLAWGGVIFFAVETRACLRGISAW